MLDYISVITKYFFGDMSNESGLDLNVDSVPVTFHKHRLYS